MLGKQQRLTRAQFDEHFKHGKRHHSPSLQLIHSSAPTFHGAVVVGKKVYKKAVDRNRLRRRLYGILYREKEVAGLSGVYILIAKPAAKTLTQKELLTTTQELIRRSK